jgi:hypothetical protein
MEGGCSCGGIGNNDDNKAKVDDNVLLDLRSWFPTFNLLETQSLPGLGRDKESDADGDDDNDDHDDSSSDEKPNDNHQDPSITSTASIISLSSSSTTTAFSDQIPSLVDVTDNITTATDQWMPSLTEADNNTDPSGQPDQNRPEISIAPSSYSKLGRIIDQANDENYFRSNSNPSRTNNNDNDQDDGGRIDHVDHIDDIDIIHPPQDLEGLDHISLNSQNLSIGMISHDLDGSVSGFSSDGGSNMSTPETILDHTTTTPNTTASRPAPSSNHQTATTAVGQTVTSTNGPSITISRRQKRHQALIGGRDNNDDDSFSKTVGRNGQNTVVDGKIEANSLRALDDTAMSITSRRSQRSKRSGQGRTGPAGSSSSSASASSGARSRSSRSSSSLSITHPTTTTTTTTTTTISHGGPTINIKYIPLPSLYPLPPSLWSQQQKQRLNDEEKQRTLLIPLPTPDPAVSSHSLETEASYSDHGENMSDGGNDGNGKSQHARSHHDAAETMAFGSTHLGDDQSLGYPSGATGHSEDGRTRNDNGSIASITPPNHPAT